MLLLFKVQRCTKNPKWNWSYVWKS